MHPQQKIGIGTKLAGITVTRILNDGVLCKRDNGEVVKTSFKKAESLLTLA